ncbi:hypothetical protein STEG23_021255, partial [Scotinomys teguina]
MRRKQAPTDSLMRVEHPDTNPKVSHELRFKPDSPFSMFFYFTLCGRFFSALVVKECPPNQNLPCWDLSEVGLKFRPPVSWDLQLIDGPIAM